MTKSTQGCDDFEKWYIWYISTNLLILFLSFAITTRQRSCGRVMLLHLFVCVMSLPVWLPGPMFFPVGFIMSLPVLLPSPMFCLGGLSTRGSPYKKQGRGGGGGCLLGGIATSLVLTLVVATKADSTNPTGMHTCWFLFWIKTRQLYQRREILLPPSHFCRWNSSLIKLSL